MTKKISKPRKAKGARKHARKLKAQEARSNAPARTTNIKWIDKKMLDLVIKTK